jgi:hypothetical protein
MMRRERAPQARTELDKAHRLLSQMIGWQHDAEVAKARLRAALEPFARNPHAVSLAEALGHITREDLLRAVKAIAREDAPREPDLEGD